MNIQGSLVVVLFGFVMGGTARAENHAAGVLVGQVAQMDAEVENVDTPFNFNGYMARVRYEFRKRDSNVAAGGYLQSFRVENTYADPAEDGASERLASNGIGLNVGYLIGGSGEIDLGLGYQPAQFKKTSGSGDEAVTETHTYATGFNFNFGITLAPSIGRLAIPLRVQFDGTTLSAGKADGESSAVLRQVSLYSKSFLAGFDILY
jgi:hypothetical protein